MLSKSEVSARILNDFIENHYSITGVWLDHRQAKLIMGLAVKQALRTGAKIAEEEKVNLEELNLDTSFGRLEFFKREVTTGGFGEKPTKVLDEEGNQVYKYVPKMRFSKAIAEEVLALSKTADEETLERVNERTEKENNWINPYKEEVEESERWSVADHLNREILNTIAKILQTDFGIDIWNSYAKIKENEGLVDFNENEVKPTENKEEHTENKEEHTENKEEHTENKEEHTDEVKPTENEVSEASEVDEDDLD